MSTLFERASSEANNKNNTPEVRQLINDLFEYARDRATGEAEAVDAWLKAEIQSSALKSAGLNISNELDRMKVEIDPLAIRNAIHSMHQRCDIKSDPVKMCPRCRSIRYLSKLVEQLVEERSNI